MASIRCCLCIWIKLFRLLFGGKYLFAAGMGSSSFQSLNMQPVPSEWLLPNDFAPCGRLLAYQFKGLPQDCSKIQYLMAWCECL